MKVSGKTQGWKKLKKKYFPQSENLKKPKVVFQKKFGLSRIVPKKLKMTIYALKTVLFLLKNEGV